MCTQISGTKVCIIYYLFAHVRSCSSMGKFVSWRFRFLRGSIHHSAAFKPLEQHEEEKEEVRSRLWVNSEDVCNGTTLLPIGKENKQDSSCIYNPYICTQAKRCNQNQKLVMETSKLGKKKKPFKYSYYFLKMYRYTRQQAEWTGSPDTLTGENVKRWRVRSDAGRAGQDFRRITAYVLHAIQWKHVQITIVPCRNLRNVSFIWLRTIKGTQ